MSLPLYCLGGGPAAAPIIEGWSAYQSLPESARATAWDLVADGVAHPTAPGFLGRFEGFCQTHGLEEETLRSVLHACGILLSQATAYDLNKEQLRSDLVNLSRNDETGFDELLSRFDAYKRDLRRAMEFGTLADHGKVLTGLDWRVDRVASSNRAAQLNTDIIYLTLRYRDGEVDGRITLQVSSTGIQELKTFLGRFEA